MTIKISLAASEKKCSFTFLDKETYCQAPFCGGVVKERHPPRVGTGQTMAGPDKPWQDRTKAHCPICHGYFGQKITVRFSYGLSGPNTYGSATPK